MNPPRTLLAAMLLAAPASPAFADAQLTSWFTADSGKYARIYQSTADETNRVVSYTWSRGTGTQSNPTYATVSEVLYSTSWVYIRTTGLASHIMGPWYLDAAKSQNFPNFPSNTAVIYRIPRTPNIPASKTLTGLGATGRAVNGVSMFDSRDAFSYSNSNATDATPVNGVTGDGIWNRDGYHNEGVTFDPALAHQAGNNYHYHAHPIALRYQLGDHVDYNAVTNRYTESAAAPTKHSPIVAWAADGLPVYGPYGYATAMDAGSGVRRMVSGFVLRNGSSGTTNLTSTGRATLPAWAARVQGRSATLSSNQYGPAVSTNYALGHYIEDFDYLGDLGFTQGTDFDLNEQNVRFCVTPEYPSGTYAYFTTINADGTPAYPYTTGRQYFGSPTGGAVTSITETVSTQFSGGPNKQETATSLTVDDASGDAAFAWSAVQGGTYEVTTSSDLTTWTALTPTVTATDDTASKVESGGLSGGATRRFYKAVRTALATFDSNGFNYTPAPSAPSVTTSAATGVGATTATLNGSVNANGSSTTVTFEYGTDTSYGTTVTAAQSPVTGSTATTVSAALTGLTASTTYHFRAKGVNSLGTTYGGDLTFTAGSGGGGSTSTAPGGSAARGTTVTVTITLPANPPNPPANVAVTSATMAGSIAGTILSHTAANTVVATFAIPANAPTGAQNIVVIFPNQTGGQITYTMTGAFTIN